MADFVEVASAGDLARRVAELGQEISEDYAGREPVMIGVLNGCVPFFADLVRAMSIDLAVDFLSLTRFDGSGRVGMALDAGVPLGGRDVILVEDIVDTGLTLVTLRKMLELHGLASLATVALLDKAPRRIVEVPLEYRGFEVGDEFLIGYGLDWNHLYRNARSLWAVMDLSVLQGDVDAFAPYAYPATV
jgi:hypoxanthine phosphoribosyltransferase